MIRRILNHALATTALSVSCGVPVVAAAQDRDTIFDVPERPTLNFYGTPGLIDMPSGEALPDGQVTVGVSYFGGQSRSTLSFQATPRISASFRYIGVRDLDLDDNDIYRDRSFDVRFLLNRESRYLPSVTVGLQDLAGTSLYSSEFVAATKTFTGAGVPGEIKATVGLGWGRFASSGAIGNPTGLDRGRFDPNSPGGDLSTDQWFRGDTAPFAGIEWQVNDKLGLKAEYSSDAYDLESDAGVIDRASRFNFGAEYQVNEAVRLGAYYLYGSEVGVNVQIQLNPNRPYSLLRTSAPRPYDVRPQRAADPTVYSGEWAQSTETASTAVRDALIPLLEAEGLVLVEVSTTASTTEVRFRNERYGATPVALGRVARAMARVLPPSVETFRLTPMVSGLPQSTIVFRRSDLEALEFSPDATQELLAVTGFEAARPRLPTGVRNEALYPDFEWSFGPYLTQRWFDPERPIRADAGLELNLAYRPAPGWNIAGRFQHRLIGNNDEIFRQNQSNLPRVRSDAVEYDQGSDTTIPRLYVSRQWKAGTNVYARVSAGYLERMFGGVSGEVLWKPVTSRLALGVEANYVKQRAFDDPFEFRDYSIGTGHVSAYYEFRGGFTGQIDVGRYLAGDYGATVTLEREFANGWKVGGFFTLTDATSEEFGAGSFDKGISLTIPVDWLIGTPDRRKRSTTVRPFSRDGGARLSVPGRLYEQVRSGHRETLVGNWSGVWE